MKNPIGRPLYNGGKSTTIRIRLKDEIIARLDAMAAREDRNRTDILRLVIRDGMASRNTARVIRGGK